MHIFPVVAEVQFIQRKFGREIFPGDVFFANDYSEGGTHLNDVLLCTPLFVEDELVAFVAVRGHLVDVGGMSPGSITGAAREIFQEGMRIPTIKLYEQGKLVKSFMGDVSLQRAAARGERRRFEGPSRGVLDRGKAVPGDV